MAKFAKRSPVPQVTLPPPEPSRWEFSREVPTPDDWHPTFADGTVHVRVFLKAEGLERVPERGWLRASVWSGDDTNMARNWYGTLDELREIYLREVRYFANLAITTFRDLEARGFHQD